MAPARNSVLVLLGLAIRFVILPASIYRYRRVLVSVLHLLAFKSVK